MTKRWQESESFLLTEMPNAFILLEASPPERDDKWHPFRAARSGISGHQNDRHDGL